MINQNLDRIGQILSLPMVVPHALLLKAQWRAVSYEKTNTYTKEEKTANRQKPFLFLSRNKYCSGGKNASISTVLLATVTLAMVKG